MKDFAEDLLPFERNFFLWLNSAHNEFWDIFMKTYSGKILWIPLVLLLLFVIVYKSEWRKVCLFIFCAVVLATLCDQLSAGVVKPFFSRLRPTHHPDFMEQVLTVNNYRGGRFGFVSAHATNGFGMATFLALVFKQVRLAIVLLIWALITCYSRIYLGVHFVTDIIGGILLGSVLGYLVYLLHQYGRIKILKEDASTLKYSLYSEKQGNILIAGIVITISVNFLYSLFHTYLA